MASFALNYMKTGIYKVGTYWRINQHRFIERRELKQVVIICTYVFARALRVSHSSTLSKRALLLL